MKEVGVCVVKHTKGSIDLSVQLTNHTGEENHGTTVYEENIKNPLWEAPKSCILDRRPRDIDTENNKNNHKLTTEEVTIKVISLVTECGTFVGNWVRILVKFTVHRCKSNKRSLSSFNHGQPENSNPDQEVCSNWVGVIRKLSLPLGNKCHNHDNGENKKYHRVDTLENREGIHLVFVLL